MHAKHVGYNHISRLHYPFKSNSLSKQNKEGKKSWMLNDLNEKNRRQKRTHVHQDYMLVVTWKQHQLVGTTWMLNDLVSLHTQLSRFPKPCVCRMITFTCQLQLSSLGNSRVKTPLKDALLARVDTLLRDGIVTKIWAGRFPCLRATDLQSSNERYCSIHFPCMRPVMKSPVGVAAKLALYFLWYPFLPTDS